MRETKLYRVHCRSRNKKVEFSISVRANDILSALQEGSAIIEKQYGKRVSAVSAELIVNGKTKVAIGNPFVS